MKRLLLIVLLVPAWTGCRFEMHDQPKRDAYQSTRFYENRASARPLLPGTIARGTLHTNELIYGGLKGTNLVEKIPVPVVRWSFSF